MRKLISVLILVTVFSFAYSESSKVPFIVFGQVMKQHKQAHEGLPLKFSVNGKEYITAVGLTPFGTSFYRLDIPKEDLPGGESEKFNVVLVDAGGAPVRIESAKTALSDKYIKFNIHINSNEIVEYDKSLIISNVLVKNDKKYTFSLKFAPIKKPAVKVAKYKVELFLKSSRGFTRAKEDFYSPDGEKIMNAEYSLESKIEATGGYALITPYNASGKPLFPAIVFMSVISPKSST